MRPTEYIYKTPDVCEAIGVSRMTLYTWEQLGKFTPPRSMGGHRVFTEKQLKQIVKAFLPGGRGKWHFNPDV